MQNKFVHLHLHTEYSLLDGAARIKQVVAKAKEMGMSALAITDHGAMFGVLEFYKECLNTGIKPILGCEIYIAPRRMSDRTHKIDDQMFHLVLLAENIEGYRNLMKLVSLGYTKGFYYKPRIDKETLAKHSKGLIALSACTAGEVAANIIAANYEGALTAAEQYRDIFGENNFFLELQYHGMKDQHIANEGILHISKKIGLPIVITNDVHYTEQKDAEIQDILMCIQTGKTIADEDRMKFTTDQLYLKSAEEMMGAFSGMIGKENCMKAFRNTIAISERIDLKLEFDKIYLPKYEVPDEYRTADIFLAELCRKGLEKLYSDSQGNISIEAKKRLARELHIISKMGFADYFLIVWDFINYAKQKGIPIGPGRGSVAGSIVAYCLGIVEVDPLKHDLLFERFLNPERISMPDIDVDICQERRSEVIEYIMQKYGSDNVAQIITFGTMAARAAVRDVGRVLNYPYAFVDKIAKMIPAELNITIEKALKTTELGELYQSNENVKKLIDIASVLEGMPRHASTHAAGLVISEKSLTVHLPLYRTSDNVITTQFDMNAVEKLGLLKMDLLGLRNLTIISETLKMLIKDKKISPSSNIYSVPLDDAKTYAMLCAGKSLGVFQLESSGMRSLMKKLKPSVFEDIVALVALYRPGPLGSGMVDDFIKNKHGLQKVDYFHRDLEPILKETYGVILYQEQVMKIAQVMAGYTYAQADLLRKAMSKKIPEEMKKHRTWFVYGDENNGIPGAVAKGYEKALANKIFDMMEYFAGYGFNKSHSVAYALLAYQTAYLKANFAAYYMAALLTSVKDNADKVSLYIDECKRLGAQVMPPDINESAENFCVSGEGKNFQIRFGLAAIKNVGGGAVRHIIEVRKAEPFKHFTDFCSRIDPRIVNKRVVESLIKAGCFDDLLGYKKYHKTQIRQTLLSNVERGIEFAHKSKYERESGQISLFDLTANEKRDELVKFDNTSCSTADILAFERETMGLYISAHPLDEYKEVFKDVVTHRIVELLNSDVNVNTVLCGTVTNVKVINTSRGKQMAFVQLEDMTGKCELVLFPNIYQKHIKLFKEGINIREPLLTYGCVLDSESEVKVRAEDIRSVKELDRTLYLRLDDRDQSKLTEIENIIKKHRGKQKVVIYYSSTKEKELLNIMVDVPGAVLEELAKILGRQNVVVKWKSSYFNKKNIMKKHADTNNAFLIKTDQVLCYNNLGYNDKGTNGNIYVKEQSSAFRSLLDF